MSVSPEPFEARGSSGDAHDHEPFVLQNDDVRFAPKYYPERYRVRKQRELDRSSGFCKAEDVSDTGSKNREIHISGIMLDYERYAFDDLLDSGNTFDMVSDVKTMEVYVAEGEYDGPYGYDPHAGVKQWEYSLDVVSSGRDESERSGNGIISTGEIDFET